MPPFWEKTRVFFSLMLFIMGFCLSPVIAQEIPAARVENTAETALQSSRLVVTYFHTTFRCPTCHRIENYSNHAIHANFENQLQSGKIVWQVINVDKPENKHFIKEYQLYSKHLIVSQVKDGKTVRWKDLKKVWMLVRSEKKFEDYVKTEISDWLKE
ncbi:MAG: nitrophenyl compound nitroreductase subunit ArsF family protein [Thermodesulfobacteriota bacterium]|nr:nitrophenyl compound nitroreductase subunit ArsF family protein [Thermodesulfobacteriota bacterium]